MEETLSRGGVGLRTIVFCRDFHIAFHSVVLPVAFVEHSLFLAVLFPEPALVVRAEVRGPPLRAAQIVCVGVSRSNFTQYVFRLSPIFNALMARDL